MNLQKSTAVKEKRKKKSLLPTSKIYLNIKHKRQKALANGAMKDSWPGEGNRVGEGSEQSRSGALSAQSVPRAEDK